MKIVLRGMKPPPARTRSTVSGSVGFRRSNNWAVGPSPVLRHHGYGVMQIVGAECGEGSHRARVLGFRTVRTCRREVAKVVGGHEGRFHVNRERKKMGLRIDRHRVDQLIGCGIERRWQRPIHLHQPVLDRRVGQIRSSSEVPPHLVEDFV